MKLQLRSTLLVFVLLSFQSVVYAQLKGDSYAQAKARGEANWYCTFLDTEGFNQVNASGEAIGVCPDMMQSFADFVEREEGIKVTIDYKKYESVDDFNTFLNEVKKSQGGVFGLGNITITEARKQSFQFSPPFINNISVLITHKSVPTLSSLSNISTEFEDMTAYVSKGTTSEERLLAIKKAHFPGMQINYIPANEFQSLVTEKSQSIFIKDQKAFVTVDFIYYLELIQKGIPVKRHAVGDDKTEQFGLIMPKGSDWSPLMDKFMKEYTKSSAYKKSLTKHLSASTARFLGKFD